MRKGRLLAGAFALLFVVVGCGDSGEPTSFEDPEVWENVRSGCIETGDEDLEPQAEANLLAVCECAFAEASKISQFDEFLDEDDRFRSNISDISDSLHMILRQCILDEAGF